MYFDNFPTTSYETLDGENILVTDIVRVVSVPSSIMNDDNLYDFYAMADNETPEIVSHKFYGSTAYHWVIMLLNQRYDLWSDFPVSDSIIRKACEDKYGGIDVIHHHEDSNGNWVDEYTFPKLPVTAYEYELALNEEKRIVKVLKKAYLPEFIQSYTELIEND